MTVGNVSDSRFIEHVREVWTQGNLKDMDPAEAYRRQVERSSTLRLTRFFQDEESGYLVAARFRESF